VRIWAIRCLRVLGKTDLNNLAESLLGQTLPSEESMAITSGAA
jgi:hypothetical protein